MNSNKISLLVTVHFILQYFQICSEGCPEAAKWSDLTQDVADTEQSDSMVQEQNRGCEDIYQEYKDLANQKFPNQKTGNPVPVSLVPS